MSYVSNAYCDQGSAKRRLLVRNAAVEVSRYEEMDSGKQNLDVGSCRGLMVGLAVGDCFGRPVEGHRRVREDFVDELLARPGILPYSDDTAMSIALVESLLESGGFDGQDMADRFAGLWESEPFRGYGRGVVDVFESVSRGVSWDQAARIQFDGEGSHGNGGAMRVAAVAVWAYPDLAGTIELALTTSSVTHTHPVGLEGAVIQAVAAHHALNGDGFDSRHLLAELDRLVETEAFTAKLEILATALDKQDDDWARLHLGNWVAADKSVLTALYAFLSEPDFVGTVRRAIGMGGDTDTIGAMAGALAGARYGIEQIPDEWSRRVEGFDDLILLADRLHARVVGSEDRGSGPGPS